MGDSEADRPRSLSPLYSTVDRWKGIAIGAGAVMGVLLAVLGVILVMYMGKVNRLENERVTLKYDLGKLEERCEQVSPHRMVLIEGAINRAATDSSSLAQRTEDLEQDMGKVKRRLRMR